MKHCSHTDDMWGNIGENIIATIAFPPTFSTGLVTKDHRGGGGPWGGTPCYSKLNNKGIPPPWILS
jgi:hypothetical protein